jgi:2-polyprenyl-3-methyl-5-hydroxy-6-metoxy-1,4-benzoquinol methylase
MEPSLLSCWGACCFRARPCATSRDGAHNDTPSSGTTSRISGLRLPGGDGTLGVLSQGADSHRATSGSRRAGVCWVCGGTRTHEAFQGLRSGAVVADDLKVTDARYGLCWRMVRCASCGLVFADPPPETDLEQAYADLEDPEYEEGNEYRLLQMRRLMWSITRRRSSGTLLDVGAGTGLLVRAAQEAGFQAIGVEPSRRAATAARSLNGVEVLQGVLPHAGLGDARFDVITAVDVIEHVMNPVGLLRTMVGYLAPGGLLVVTTPDVSSWAPRVLGRRWWHCRLAHVCFFDPGSMQEAAERASLTIVGKERQLWWFSVEYLANRVGGLVPVLGRVTSRVVRALPSAVGRQLVPLNLMDSWVYFCSRR